MFMGSLYVYGAIVSLWGRRVAAMPPCGHAGALLYGVTVFLWGHRTAAMPPCGHAGALLYGAVVPRCFCRVAVLTMGGAAVVWGGCGSVGPLCVCGAAAVFLWGRGGVFIGPPPPLPLLG